MNNNQSTLSEIIGFQLHYTSCRYGLSGYAGFQTRAMSRDIKPEEQRAVERLGIYKPPRHLPDEPNQSEIDGLFPKAYRHTYLESGRLAIVKSVYVGQDYTQRWGNYFSHSLIIDRLLEDIWPVDLYEWDGWKNQVLPDEDIESASFELLPVKLTPNIEAYSFPSLQEFMAEEPEHKNQLAAMIQAVFLRPETSRNVVIIEELETNGLFWIACLQKSFPPSHQKELGCSSFQFDPRACLAINVTLGETDLVLGDNERKYQFYVFDFVTGNHSNIESINEYAATISAWMTDQPHKLQAFYDFTRQFDHNTLNQELESLLDLFKLKMGDLNIAQVEETQLVDILTFASSYTKHFADILKVIGSVIEKLDQSETSANLTHLARFFINGAIATKAREYRQIAYKLIIRLFYLNLLDEGRLTDEFHALQSEAKKAFKSYYGQEFSAIFLSEEHLSKIASKIEAEGLRPEQLSIIINEMIGSIQALKPEVKVYNDERLWRFVIKPAILAQVPKLDQLDWLLEPFIDDKLAVASLCAYVSVVLKGQLADSLITQNDYEESMKTLAKFLGHLLDAQSETYRFHVINTMKENPDTWLVLRHEWKYAIAKQRDKKTAHKAYHQQILQQESEFSQHYRQIFADKLWQLLSKKEQLAQAIAWIREQQTKSFSPELVKKVFQTASEKVSFEPPAPSSVSVEPKSQSQSDKLYEMLVKQVSHHQIELRPNRLMLREAVLKANDEVFDFDKQPLHQIQPALTGVDNKTYKEFTQHYLPLILSRLTEKQQHGSVIKAVFIPSHVEIFKQSYGLFYDKMPSDKLGKADMAALTFWVSLTSDDEDYNTLQYIEESAIDLLSSRIAKLKSKTYYFKVVHHFEDQKMGEEAKNRWELIYSQAEEKRNSLLHRGLSLLSKLFKRSQ